MVCYEVLELPKNIVFFIRERKQILFDIRMELCAESGLVFPFSDKFFR
jgi:hypothetical protein